MKTLVGCEHNDTIKCVIIISPFRGGVKIDTNKQGINAAIDVFESKKMLDEFKNYALRCMLDCLKHNESPNVPHILLPMVLDDTKQDQRWFGMKCGQAWHRKADHIVVYTDYGITEGMHEDIINADKYGIDIVYRKLYA